MAEEYRVLHTETELCDGGEYSVRYPSTNVLKAEDSVYCSKRNICNLILRIADPQANIKDITITAPPRSGYTNPVEHVAIFLSMNNHHLIERSDRFLRNSEVAELFNPDRDFLSNSVLFPFRNKERHIIFENSSALEDTCPVVYESLVPNYDIEFRSSAEPRHLDLTACIRDPLCRPCKVHTPLSFSRYNPNSETLPPIVLGTISNNKDARQLRATLDTPIPARYVLLRMTNTFPSGGNVDIESVVFRGSVGSLRPTMSFR